MTSEEYPNIYVEYSADNFPPQNWTDISTYLDEFTVKNSGILKVPEAELIINNRNGRYTGNGALTLDYYKFIRIRADVRGVIDTLFFGTINKMHSESKGKQETLTVTAKDDVIDRLLRDFITKKYNTEFRENVNNWFMKDVIIDFLENPDSAQNNLKLYFNLDEGSGNIAHDKSRNGNNGNIYGATWVDGMYGKALSFDGANYYVNFPSYVLTNYITVSVWVKLNQLNLGHHQRIVQVCNTGNVGGFTLQEQSGSFYFYIYIAGVGWKSANTTADTNWHHLIATYDGTQVKLYKDGVLTLGDMISGVMNVPSSPLNYMMRSYDNYYVGGILDEVRIYDRALNPDDFPIVLVTDAGSITTTSAAHDFDRESRMDALKKICSYVGYSGYGEVSGSDRVLYLYPYGSQATSPLVDVTNPLTRQWDKGLDEVYNHIFVWSTVQGAYPNRDFTTEGGVAQGYWSGLNAENTVSDETTIKKVNQKSIKVHKTAGSQTGIGAICNLTGNDVIYVNEKKLTYLSFALKSDYVPTPPDLSEFIAVYLKDTAGKYIKWEISISLLDRVYADGWTYYNIPLGTIFRPNIYTGFKVKETQTAPYPKDVWYGDIGQTFNWIIQQIWITAGVPIDKNVNWYIDGLHFACPFTANPLEDTSLQSYDDASINAYGRRVLYHDEPSIIYGDLLKSMADAILAITKNPVPQLKVKYGAKTWVKPNQYVTVTVPQYGINNEQWRIVEVEFDWHAKTKMLHSTLSLTPRYQPVTDREWFAGLIEGILKNISW